jgi:hypothetical protein
MSDYVTAFDFSTRLPFGWHVWTMIAAVIVFAVAVPLRFRQTGRWRAAFVALIGSLAVVGAVIFSSAMQYLEVASAVHDGRIQVVEGTIVNFAQAARRHPIETFELGGQQFSYRDTLLSPGYSGTQLFGGGVRDGMRARVAYYDASWHQRVITKLEIAE